MKPDMRMTVLKNLNSISCEINEILKELKRLGQTVNDLMEWVQEQEKDKE